MKFGRMRLAQQGWCAPFHGKCGVEMVRRVFALVAGIMALAASLPGQLQQSTLQPAPADAVVITVTRLGPYPVSFNHSAGPFVLWVMNHSNVREDSFSIVDDTTGVPVPRLPVLHSTPSSYVDRALIQLPPGTYRLAFQSHSRWAVKIIITAN